MNNKLREILVGEINQIASTVKTKTKAEIEAELREFAKKIEHNRPGDWIKKEKRGGSIENKRNAAMEMRFKNTVSRSKLPR